MRPGKVRLNRRMVNDRPEQSPAPDLLRQLAEKRGLAATFERFPEVVRGAEERASRPLASPPSGPLTEPAGVFDPALGAVAQ